MKLFLSALVAATFSVAALAQTPAAPTTPAVKAAAKKSCCKEKPAAAKKACCKAKVEAKKDCKDCGIKAGKSTAKK
jgi:hypothetical protein